MASSQCAHCGGTFDGRPVYESGKVYCRVCADTMRIYPCTRPGCKILRTKAEGGTTFTVCDAHWAELHANSKEQV